MKKEKKIEVPEDLGIVIARDPEEEFWLRAKRNGEQQIKDLEDQLKFNRAIMETIQKKLDDIKASSS